MKNSDYLHEKIKNYDPNEIESVENALNALKSCSFQGRNLGKALDIFSQALEQLPSGNMEN
jgi:hypothetical protein